MCTPLVTGTVTALVGLPKRVSRTLGPAAKTRGYVQRDAAPNDDPPESFVVASCPLQAPT